MLTRSAKAKDMLTELAFPVETPIVMSTEVKLKRRKQDLGVQQKVEPAFLVQDDVLGIRACCNVAKLTKYVKVLAKFE